MTRRISAFCFLSLFTIIEGCSSIPAAHLDQSPGDGARNPSATQFLEFPQCPQQDDYVVTDKMEVEVTITGEPNYMPRCLSVPRGAKVMIAATGHHHLQAMAPIQGIDNPIKSPDSFGSVSPITVTLSQPGYYGFYCMIHGDSDGNGMAGMILVRE